MHIMLDLLSFKFNMPKKILADSADNKSCDMP